MAPFSPAPRLRRRSWRVTTVLAAALFLGNAIGACADETTSVSFHNPVETVLDRQMEQIDFPQSDASLLNRTVFRNSDSSTIKLVSLEASPEAASVAYDDQTAEDPIYTMQAPEAHLSEGNVYTGPAATNGTWVLIAPYGWIAGINGQIGVGNRVVNVDITPGQVLSHLGNVDGALMLHAEVGKGDWGFILDGNLIRASTSVTTVPAQVDVSLQQTLIEALGMYRLVQASDFLVEGKSLTVDLLGGGRYYQFANGFTVHPFNPALPSIPAEITSSWVDMVIGGRARVPVTSSLDAFARADIGGFGIGSSSTLAWNVIAGLDWKMTSCSSLIVGYREMNINRFSGSGLTPFGFNAKLYGPFMAIAFQF